MNTINNAEVTTNSRSKSGAEYFNPYAPSLNTNRESVPLVTVPKNKKLVSKKQLSVMSATITILAATSILCFIQIFFMMKSSEEFYSKNMILKNTAVVTTTMELVGVEEDTLTFKNDTRTFVTKLPAGTALHLEEGETYKVSYSNGGLVYLGTVGQ